jgi:hypothetical protein
MSCPSYPTRTHPLLKRGSPAARCDKQAPVTPTSENERRRCQARRQQADRRCARGVERFNASAEHRLSVVRHPEKSTAAQHGELLLLSVAARTERSTVCTTRFHALPRAGRPRPVRQTAKASRALKRGHRIDPPGFDGGKKIKGKKRHVLVDTQGLLMHAIVQVADIQDRDGGILLMATLFGLYQFLQRLYADAGYQGPKQSSAWATRRTCLCRTRRTISTFTSRQTRANPC